MKPICVIAGITATGKSKIAITCAKKWNAEIISADSVAIYKEMNIGSAKIPTIEQEGIPHHLMDEVNLTDSYSVADFQKQGRALINEIHDRGKNVIVVGGTGLYIKALINDYRFMEETDVFIDNNMETQDLYDELRNVDPETALTIHPNNRQRIIRALSSYSNHKKERSVITNHRKDDEIIPAKVFFLQGDRKHLYERINQRVVMMFADGLIKEVDTLNKRYDDLFSYPSMSAIGYRELKDFFEMKITQEEAIELIQRNTRRFAKRQLTWFKHQQMSQWIDIEREDSQVIIEAWMAENWTD